MDSTLKRRVLVATITLPLWAACGRNDNTASDTSQTMTSDSAAGTTATANNTGSDQQVVQFLASANRAEVEAGRLAVSKARNADVKAFAQRMVDDHTRGLQMLSDMAGRSGWTMPDSMALSSGTEMGAGSANAGGTNGTSGTGATAGAAGGTGAGATGVSGTNGASDIGTRVTPGAVNTSTSDAVAQFQAQHMNMMNQLRNASGATFDKNYISSQVTAHQQVLDQLRQMGTQVQNSELRTQLNEAQSMVQDHLQRAQQLQQRSGA